MSWLDLAGAALNIGGSIYNSSQQKKASDSASNSLVQGNNSALDLQRSQYEQIQKMLLPFVQGGTTAFQSQQALSGALGADAQKAEMLKIEQSPQFTDAIQQGEQGILANASATGGLRGGNTQAALAQFRPRILNEMVNQKFGQYGQIASAGQNAAVNQGQFGGNYASNAGLIQQGIGQAQGQNQINRGQSNQNLFNNLSQSVQSIDFGKLF